MVDEHVTEQRFDGSACRNKMIGAILASLFSETNVRQQFSVLHGHCG